MQNFSPLAYKLREETEVTEGTWEGQTDGQMEFTVFVKKLLCSP